MKILSIVALASLTLLTACASSSGPDQSEQGACDQRANYNIQFQRFDETAQQLAHATGCFIHADLKHDGDVKVNPVQGHLSIREALEMAIQDTRLHVVAQSADSITVE